MKRDTLSYHGYRIPPEIISHAVWLYHRFGVSFRDVEDLLAQRGITVSYEAIRLWCLTFGSVYARRLKRRQGTPEKLAPYTTRPVLASTSSKPSDVARLRRPRRMRVRWRVSYSAADV